ncbi:flagellar assembly protein FlgT [Shewanella sp. SR44-3]|uniref:flagellar assembly protein FlgT n=1 Tax=Shewanella sp. SR44-3 TaxID=2760936 RepID=UPI0015FCBE6B|nr:flagellar assembly protein FlgT [Shewanella sp. SR44-3]MBB1268111.1 flagella assembly protein FlgT [Shewanella sp. SR44-3]
MKAQKFISSQRKLKALKRHITLALVSLGSLIFMAQAYSEQVEVTGKARIVNDDFDKAREDAISQALNYASLKAGVNFNSEQKIEQGRLTQDSFSMQRMGVADNIVLVSESVSHNILTVVLALELSDQESNTQCQKQGLKAAIMLPQATIADRAQLRYGQLAKFEQAVSQKLGNVINAQSNYSFMRIHADEKLDQANTLTNFKGYRIPSWLGEITDSQYLLQPEILDISLQEGSSSYMGFVSEPDIRQFSFKLTLYHGISGEVVWSKSFSDAAVWEFAPQEIVSPASHQFWNSAYGQSMLQLFQESSLALDDELSCRPLLGQIIARQGERIIINLGRKNGVRTGDKFQIILQQNIPDRFNSMRTIATESQTNVTIDQVSEDTATAALVGIDAADNIQLQDIALKL